MGSLTLHLDEDNWSKGQMYLRDNLRVREIFENLSSGRNLKKESPDPKQQQAGKVNLGENLVSQAMRVVKA